MPLQFVNLLKDTALHTGIALDTFAIGRLINNRIFFDYKIPF